MDRLETLRVFRKVADRQNFSAAARELGLSNAAVSKHIARLEADLGARLIDRTTRRMSLTEAGRAYFDRCVRILDDLAEADQAVGRLSAAPRGLLRVTAPASFGVPHLSRLMPEFMARHPELSVDLSFNDRFVDLVGEGVDLAVRIRTDLPDSQLVVRRLAPVERVLCAAPAYIARRGEPRHPRELGDHDCIVYTLSTTPGEWRFEGPDGALTVPINGRFRCNNGQAMLAAAEAGIGIALSPIFSVAGALRAGRVKPLLTEWQAPAHALYLVYPPGRHLSPKVRAFADFLAERFAPPVDWDAAM
jgi:DNA-binding transcriptional LysR family regulator